jgi:transposase
VTRAAGYRIRGGATETFLARLAALELPAALGDSLTPVRQVITVLEQELAAADTRVATLTAEVPVVRRLTTVPSMCPVTATAFVAALDDFSDLPGGEGPRK